MTAREDVESVLQSPVFRHRLLATARLDAGVDAEDLAAQLSFEACRAADKQREIAKPEAFVWACYRFCKRDWLRKQARLAKRQ